MQVLNGREVAGHLEHGGWSAADQARARADLAAHGYVFVTDEGGLVPHPSPPFTPEDWPTRVLAWAKGQ